MKTLTQAPLLHLQETLTEDVRRVGQGEGLVYIVLMLVIDPPSLPLLGQPLQEQKMRELIEKDEKELSSLIGLCQR